MNKEMKIIMIGDSLTSGFDTKTLLPELNIVNKGIYGDNILGVTKRFKNDVKDEKPDILFILIGTNDFALGRTNHEILKLLEELISTAVDKLSATKIFITSILPTNNIENRPKERILKINEGLKKLATIKNIFYLDLHSQFIDCNDNLRSEFTSDGLHLNNHGYNHWANILSDTLSKIIYSS
jgi:lysophospholipase L1-like esterase